MATRAQSYWRVVHGLMDRYDLTAREARGAWRELRDVLDRRPYGTDLDRHPRLTTKAVRQYRRAEAVAEPERPPAYPRKRVEREVEEPAFEEFEITATTKGYTPRRR